MFVSCSQVSLAWKTISCHRQDTHTNSIFPTLPPGLCQVKVVPEFLVAVEEWVMESEAELHCTILVFKPAAENIPTMVDVPTTRAWRRIP